MQYCNKILNEHIRKAVYRYRKRHNLHQYQLAELLRVSARAYSYYENSDGGFSVLSFVSFLFLLLDRPEDKNNEELFTLLHDLREAVEEAEKTSE